MKQEKQRRFGSRRGQAAVIVALNLTVLLGALGFAVDLGLGIYKKHAEQAAADSAAMAAATYATANNSSCSIGITCGTVTSCTIPETVTTPFGAACVYAKANGFTNGGSSGQTVTVEANNTSSPAPGTSPSLWFKVDIAESYPAIFGRFAGLNALTIHASSVAGVNTTGGGSCIIALSTTATYGFTDSGSGNVTTTGCGIYDNAGFKYSGSGLVRTITTQYLGSSCSGCTSPNLRPQPTRAAAATPDPFLNVPSVSVPSTCTQTDYKITDSSPHTLSPGVYCGGLTISGSGNITFQSGIYILNGVGSGGKSFNYSGSGNLSGTNVLFYITAQHSYSTAGPVSISGSGNLTFSAPSSGSYEGLLFYQDRSISYSSANTYTGSGNVTGSFYFPSTSLTYSGSGNALYQAIVANTITMTGSGNFSKDVTGQYTGLVKTVSSLIQ